MRELSINDLTQVSGGIIGGGDPNKGQLNAQDTNWRDPGATQPPDGSGSDLSLTVCATIATLSVCVSATELTITVCSPGLIQACGTKTYKRGEGGDYTQGNPAGDGWGH